MNIQSSSQGIVVVERKNWFARKGGNTPSRETTASGTHAEILKRYKGIEGNAWPVDPSVNGIVLSSGFAPIEQLSSVLCFFESLSRKSEEIVDLILCDRCTSVREIRGFRFCGFDFGYYDDANSYSFVFNELIYCRFPECRSVASILNTDLLFGTLEDLKKAEECRAQLLQAGKNLEDDEAFVPLAIYTPT